MFVADLSDPRPIWEQAKDSDEPMVHIGPQDDGYDAEAFAKAGVPFGGFPPGVHTLSEESRIILEKAALRGLHIAERHIIKRDPE